MGEVADRAHVIDRSIQVDIIFLMLVETVDKVTNFKRSRKINNVFKSDQLILSNCLLPMKNSTQLPQRR